MFIYNGKRQFCFDGAVSDQSVLLNTAQYHCKVLLHAEVTCFQWSIYFISYDPVPSNQMARIYTGVI